MPSPESPREGTRIDDLASSTSPQPPDLVIFRFIKQSITNAVEAGANQMEASLEKDKAFSLKYLQGESILEKHSYPSLMHDPFLKAMRDWEKMVAPDRIQFEHLGRIVFVSVADNESAMLLGFDMEDAPRVVESKK